MVQYLVLSSILLWFLLLGNIFLTLALIRRANGKPRPSGLRVGQIAPDFTAETLQGNTVTRAEFAGNATVFLFTSPTCGPCRQLLPSLESLQPKAMAAGVDLVLVSLADSTQTHELAIETNLRLPIIVTPPNGNFATRYKAQETPSFCLVGADGVVKRAGIAGPTREWRDMTETWERSSAQVPALVPSERR